MTISKKLFLVAALGLGFGSQLSASEPNSEGVLFNFTNNLRKIKNAASLELADWIDRTYTTNHDLGDQLKNIVNTDDSVADKTKAITQLKQQTEHKGNTSFFSNISNLAKATAAFLVAASIASYFYFTRPWTSINK